MKINLKKMLKDPDVLGWVIWGALTLLLMGPCLYLMFHYTYDTAGPVMRIAVAFFVAAIVAGILSWGGNEIVYRLHRKKETEKRKPTRKAKKA